MHSAQYKFQNEKLLTVRIAEKLCKSKSKQIKFEQIQQNLIQNYSKSRKQAVGLYRDCTCYYGHLRIKYVFPSNVMDKLVKIKNLTHTNWVVEGFGIFWIIPLPYEQNMFGGKNMLMWLHVRPTGMQYTVRNTRNQAGRSQMVALGLINPNLTGV